MSPSKFAVRPYQLLLRHGGRRCQARAMALQLLCGPDRQQRPQVLYTRFRAMDPPTLQDLRMAAFEKPSHMSVSNRRYTADVRINDANCLILAQRCGGAILPDYVTACDTVGQSRRRQGILIRMGPPGPHSRISIDHSVTWDKVTELSRAPKYSWRVGWVG